MIRLVRWGGAVLVVVLACLWPRVWVHVAPKPRPQRPRNAPLPPPPSTQTRSGAADRNSYLYLHATALELYLDPREAGAELTPEQRAMVAFSREYRERLSRHHVDGAAALMDLWAPEGLLVDGQPRSREDLRESVFAQLPEVAVYVGGVRFAKGSENQFAMPLTLQYPEAAPFHRRTTTVINVVTLDPQRRRIQRFDTFSDPSEITGHYRPTHYRADAFAREYEARLNTHHKDNSTELMDLFVNETEIWLDGELRSKADVRDSLFNQLPPIRVTTELVRHRDDKTKCAIMYTWHRRKRQSNPKDPNAPPPKKEPGTTAVAVFTFK